MGAAFCPDEEVRRSGAPKGLLAGLSFAAKDLFDVAGHVTGCGNPDWRRTHPPARETAPAVEALLDAGADLAGKTITDELAFSLEGRNFHYGTPDNPNAPGRIPGGSSSGSASAVAAEQVDLAIGTDTGGSIRVPAALCGIFGFRPTHGAVSLEGVMPLAPSFDTVGWLTRDADLLARVGDVLLPPDSAPAAEATLAMAEDGFELADAEVETVLRERAGRLEREIGPARLLRVAEAVSSDLGDLDDTWMGRFRTLQGHEIWQVHGAWIEEVRPRMGPDIAGRFEWARSITDEAATEAAPYRETFIARLDALLADGTVLCLPAAPCVAPRLDAGAEASLRFRNRTLSLTSVAGLAGTPQVTLPAGRVATGARGECCPVGLSLIARRGADRALLTLARRFVPLVA